MTTHSLVGAGDFTKQAGAYGRARPSYPPALLDRLLARIGVKEGDPVADIGAGTGLFTALLASRGLAVTAVEPNDAMRAQAAPLPGVTWINGTFEQTNLPGASQKWIAAAQAYHWAKPERALPELHRALLPGGHFTALWNDREPERDPVVAWTRDAIKRYVPVFDEAYRNRDWATELAATGHFGDVAYDEERHVVPMPRQRYLDLWRSHNRLSLSAGPEGFAKLMTEIAAHLDANRVESVNVPYVTRTWTARRE